MVSPQICNIEGTVREVYLQVELTPIEVVPMCKTLFMKQAKPIAFSMAFEEVRCQLKPVNMYTFLYMGNQLLYVWRLLD